MFTGNASTEKAELRPSAIKASIRFWWRAIHPDLLSEELRVAECKLFGGSYIPKEEKKKEGKDLKVEKTKHNAPQFRVLNFTKINLGNKESNFKIDPGEPEEGDENWRKNYLNAQKAAIAPNTEFKITFLCNPDKTETLIALMHLASALGGLGNRSRRGAGVWEIKNYKIDKGDKQSLDYCRESILKSINVLTDTNVYGEERNENGDISIVLCDPDQYSSMDGFPYLIKVEIGTKKVEIGTEYDTQEVLREKIMRTAHKYKDYGKFEQFLGKATGKRLASPIYVSMLSKEKKVEPIISTLNHFFNNRNQKDGQNLQTKFKNAILNNATPEN